MQPYVQSLTNTMTSDQIGVALQQTNQDLVFPALAANQQTATAEGYAECIQPGPPALRVTNNGAGSVSLGWSPVAIKFLAEQKASLQSTNWTAISIPPRAAGNDFSVSILKTNTNSFFCLHQP